MVRKNQKGPKATTQNKSGSVSQTLPIVSGDTSAKMPPEGESALVRMVHIRITTDKLTLSQCYANTQYYLPFKVGIICIEKKGTPSQHFHMAIECSRKKEELGDVIRCIVGDVDFKGNGKFSTSWAENNDKLCSYVLKSKKQEDYMYCGFTELQIEKFVSKSFAKYDPKDIGQLIFDLEDKYMQGFTRNFLQGYVETVTIRDWIEGVLKLKADYKQNYNLKWIRDRALMLYTKKNDDYKKLSEAIEETVMKEFNRNFI